VTESVIHGRRQVAEEHGRQRLDAGAITTGDHDHVPARRPGHVQQGRVVDADAAVLGLDRAPERVDGDDAPEDRPPPPS
jgi:hypothetical protein